MAASAVAVLRSSHDNLQRSGELQPLVISSTHTFCTREVSLFECVKMSLEAPGFHRVWSSGTSLNN